MGASERTDDVEPRHPVPDWLARWAPATWPAWLRRCATVLVPAALAVAGAWIAVLVAGTTHASLGPLAVDVSLRPSLSGDSVVHLDPVGTVILDTHRAPITLEIAVRQIDIDGITGFAEDPSSLNTLDDQVSEKLPDVLIDAIIRTVVVALIGAALAAALVLRSLRRALLALGLAVAGLAATGAATAATFTADAIREPTYTGPLVAAPQLIGDTEQIATNFDAYARRLARFATNIGAVYDATLNLDTTQPAGDTIRVLHVSDLHLNPAAWDIIDAVADQYDVDTIVDSGDITDLGTALESSYVRSIEALDRPYVFVKGNHDSVTTSAAIAAQPNGIVLDNEPVEVAGLRFVGAPDPRSTPDNSVRGRNDEAIRVATEEFAELANDLDPPADVIVFHDPSHAELFDGAAPLVLAGHAHRRDTFTLDDHTRVMVQGSTGGAGRRGLAGEEPTPIALSVLYFDQESHELVAWDDLTLGGLGQTSAEISRHLTGEKDENDDESLDAPSPAPGLEN